MRKVVILVRHHGEPESDISARYPDVTLRSRSSLVGREASRKRIIECTGPPKRVADFLDEFGRAAPILDIEPLTPLGRDRVFVSMSFDASQWDSIAERLTALNVLHRSGTVIKNGWERWTLYLDDDEELSTIVDHLEAAGNDTRLRRDIDLDAISARDQFDLTQLASNLTARQTEVLTTAMELGYYQLDRDTSIEAIGDAVGVSQTTAWEHLNRAEQKVMDEIRAFLETHETPRD